MNKRTNFRFVQFVFKMTAKHLDQNDQQTYIFSSGLALGFFLIDFGLSSPPEVKIQEVQIKYVCNALNKFSDLSFNILRIFITVYQNCQSHLQLCFKRT